MSSISSITQQYAKQQQMKKTQKGGAMFDFLKSDDDSKDTEKEKVSESSTVASTKQPVDSPPSTEEKGAIDKLKETFGFGTTPEPTTVPDAVSVVKDEEVKNEGSEEKPGLLSGIFGTGESKKEEASEASDGASEASDDASEANEASDDASDDASETSEDNDDDFEMISQKMNTLREKYEKLKSDHNAMKNKMESEKEEEKKADNQKVSTLIAAFTASQGALTAFKEALIEHLKNNNYPVDGLQLDANSFNAAPAEVAVEPEQPAPAPDAAPAPVEEVVPSEQLVPAAAPDSDSDSDSAHPPVTATAENAVEPGQLTSEPTEPTEPVNGNMDTSMLESGSESEESQNSENEGVQAESSALPEIPVNEVSENNTLDNNTASAAAPESTTINGGRSHYVHSTNKKATTHRHHKRRNRHQTLRGYKK